MKEGGHRAGKGLLSNRRRKRSGTKVDDKRDQRKKGRRGNGRTGGYVRRLKERGGVRDSRLRKREKKPYGSSTSRRRSDTLVEPEGKKK